MAHHITEESSLAFLKGHAQKWLGVNANVFDKVNSVLFEKFKPKYVMDFLIKTLKNHINLWKMGIRWPLYILNALKMAWGRVDF